MVPHSLGVNGGWKRMWCLSLTAPLFLASLFLRLDLLRSCHPWLGFPLLCLAKLPIRAHLPRRNLVCQRSSLATVSWCLLSPQAVQLSVLSVWVCIPQCSCAVPGAAVCHSGPRSGAAPSLLVLLEGTWQRREQAAS